MSMKSPKAIFILYMSVSFVIIMLLQFIFPSEEAPLPLYYFVWRFNNGLKDFLYMLPSLILSGILIPFGLLYYDESFSSYSPNFLKLMRGPIIIAIASSLLYVCSVFLFTPLSQRYSKTMRSQAKLFTLAKEKMQINIALFQLSDADPFINACMSIWAKNPEIISMLETLNIIDEQATSKREVYLTPTDEPIINRAYANAQQTLDMAREAFREKRYYDAHWLSTLASRLSQNNSQRAEAVSLAQEAWNEIGDLKETENFQLYYLKRDAYDAFLAENWVKAFYALKKITAHVTEDSEINNFLAITINEMKNIAFFVDELEQIKPISFDNALFSLPYMGGRIVIRIKELSIHKGHSLGRNIEIVVLDNDGELLYQALAPYTKVIPMVEDNKTRFILQALDRNNESSVWETIFSPSDFSASYLTVDIDYEDFLALAKLSSSGVDELYVSELFRAAHNYGSFGYLKSVFYSELLYRFIEAMLFMPITIIVLCIGWHYRARGSTHIFVIVFCFIAPFIFTVLLSCYRSILGSLVTSSVIFFGFPLSVFLFIVADIALFISSLILLARQNPQKP